MKQITLAAILAPALAAAAPAQNDALHNTIYVNATIYTASDEMPVAEAMVVRADRILGIGTRREALRFIGEGDEFVDLDGAVVLPGLIDAHGHMANLGTIHAGVVDLSGTKTYEEVIERVRTRAASAPRGTWILGRGWDHESWPSRELPTHHQLSDQIPDHPVWLARVDGHAALANAAAMDAAGVDARTESPSGGEIMRGGDGSPTGVFIDNAESLIERAVPEGARGEAEDLILAAQEACLGVGLTGVHDMGIGPDEIAAYERLENDGRLKMRIYGVIHGSLAEDHFREHGIRVSDRFTLRACKLYMDGAMGSRGAWMLEPYLDRPTTRDGEPYVGLKLMDPFEIDRIARDGVRNGYQVCTHAIGDGANRRVLDAYEYAQAVAIPTSSEGVGAVQPTRPGLLHARANRLRIEHAQLISASDIPRFEAMGVIPSMQPTHCTSDMRWVEDRVGAERAKGAYAWRSLLDSGVPIAGGSDFPVESNNPFLGIYAAVTRQNLEGEPDDGWRPEQRMTRAEALKSFTIWAAYAAFEEDEKGTLEPGKLADFVVIDRDIMKCEAQGIAETRVLRTVIGGETVYGGE